ncbi:hypothetical protein DUZ99_10635 [Xylanibacillus composti]|uniref:Uncharacterized protein n=1 Tax=Xylanibacillus composti TaxID=1572762 RepID=A0A8J4M3Q1_9BACL|nr:hypothetical protein [Xylanibacillus composti]MDT9725426.1 hypothetical protein [Xylanibacillus composti]GIQ71059.1 hypothetical protein XYCOK13_38830 [Xylanibacillus composti]
MLSFGFIVSYWLFSSLEVFAILCFSFSVFRMRLQTRVIPFIAVALTFGYLNYLLWHVYELVDYIILIQALVLLLCIWAISGKPWLSALFMTLAGFLFYGTVQSLVILLLDSLHVIWIQDIQPDSTQNFIIQSAAAMFTIGLSLLLHRKKWGFLFLRHRKQGDRRLRRMLVTLALISVPVTEGIYRFIFLSNPREGAWILMYLHLFLVIIMLIYAYQKEKIEARLKYALYKKRW